VAAFARKCWLLEQYNQNSKPA